MGDWTNKLRLEATTRVVAEVEAADAGMLCTENEVLFINASGTQRAPVSEISKVSRDGPDLVIAGANSTFIRGVISLDKLTLMNFFAEVRHASAQAKAKREVLLDTSAPLISSTLNLPSQPTASISSLPPVQPDTPNLGRAMTTAPAANLNPPVIEEPNPINRGVNLAPRMSNVQAPETSAAFQPAGFGSRLLAYIIDYLLIGAASTVLLVVLGGGSIMSLVAAFGNGNDAMNNTAFVSSVASLVGAYLFWLLLVGIGSWLYFALLESSERQATLGKLAAGVFVSNTNGNRISFAQASGRYWSKIGVSIAIGFIGGLIGLPFRDNAAVYGLLQLALFAGILYTYIMCATTPKKQTLYDQIAGTLVWKR